MFKFKKSSSGRQQRWPQFPDRSSYSDRPHQPLRSHAGRDRSLRRRSMSRSLAVDRGVEAESPTAPAACIPRRPPLSAEPASIALVPMRGCAKSASAGKCDQPRSERELVTACSRLADCHKSTPEMRAPVATFRAPQPPVFMLPRQPWLRIDHECA